MLEWKSDYETGVPEIDTQHKVLFANINRLEEALTNREINRVEADYLLDFLDKYAEQHFKGEETCMARFRCPAHAKNKEEHARFLDFLRFARGEYAVTTAPRNVLEGLHESMVSWIKKHILTVDIQLRDCTGAKACAN
jgi:hemerythrin